MTCLIVIGYKMKVCYTVEVLLQAVSLSLILAFSIKTFSTVLITNMERTTENEECAQHNSDYNYRLYVPIITL